MNPGQQGNIWQIGYPVDALGKARGGKRHSDLDVAGEACVSLAGTPLPPSPRGSPSSATRVTPPHSLPTPNHNRRYRSRVSTRGRTRCTCSPAHWPGMNVQASAECQPAPAVHAGASCVPHPLALRSLCTCFYLKRPSCRDTGQRGFAASCFLDEHKRGSHVFSLIRMLVGRLLLGWRLLAALLVRMYPNV